MAVINRHALCWLCDSPAMLIETCRRYVRKDEAKVTYIYRSYLHTTPTFKSCYLPKTGRKIEYPASHVK